MRFRVPVTMCLIGTSIFFTLVSNFGSNVNVLSTALISLGASGFDEISAGEMWRFVTPAFAHFSIYHLVFNLLWVWVLGSAIEMREGSLKLLGIFLVSTVVSNIAEYFASGPLFGGMSGFVYALFGYIWMQMKYNQRVYGGVIPPAIVPLMLIWFVVCWLGIVSNIANMAHTAGLIVGILWGRINAMRTTRRRLYY